jgi:uncharacterized membrane protein YedE/YeeE
MTSSRLPGFLILGTLFGIVLVKSEVVSWFRIQEMFRFQSFHMYGTIMSAVVTAAASIALIRRFKVRTVDGAVIEIPAKKLGRGFRYVLGGLMFGVGWSLVGACPGPMFALAGAGIGVYAVSALSAVGGTWLYGLVRDRLPHY